MKPYTKKAAKYYEFLQPNEFKKAGKQAEFITSFFGKKTKRVLDAACGVGRLSIEFADMGYEVTGLDITPAMLEVAKQHPANKIKYIEGDMCIYTNKKKFDAIVCGSNTLPHLLTNKKAVQCLKNLKKNLSEKGTLVFYIWDCDKWKDHFVVRRTVEKNGVTVSFVEHNWIDRETNIYRWRNDAKINDHGKKDSLVFGGRLKWRTGEKWIQLLKEAGFKKPVMKKVGEQIYFIAKNTSI